MASQNSDLRESPKLSFLNFLLANNEEISNRLKEGSGNEEVVDYCLYRLERLINVAMQGSCVGFIEEQVVDCLSNAFTFLENTFNVNLITFIRTYY